MNIINVGIMPKFKVDYHGIPYGAGLFATPVYERSEFIDAANLGDLDKYILSQKDSYGNKFKKDKSFGYDYISNSGGVKVSLYNPPVFKEPKFKKIK